MRYLCHGSLAALVVALALLGGCIDPGPTDPAGADTGSNDTQYGTSGPTSSIDVFYDRMPDVHDCDAGQLKWSERQKVLDHLNAIRAIHGLEPVEYRAEDDALTSHAALLIASNRVLTHDPNPSMSCYSEQGKTGCSTSNIAMSTFFDPNGAHSSESWIDLWIRDENVATLGHRRWLLDPFLKYISFDRVDVAPSNGASGVSAAVIKVVNDEMRDVSTSTVDFVAVPFHEYPGDDFEEGLELSFSVLADRTSWSANAKVDLSKATISMVDAGGHTIEVHDVATSNDYAGLPNLLRWKAPIVRGSRYAVDVRGVMVDGAPREYHYWFTLGAADYRATARWWQHWEVAGTTKATGGRQTAVHSGTDG